MLQPPVTLNTCLRSFHWDELVKRGGKSSLELCCTCCVSSQRCRYPSRYHFIVAFGASVKASAPRDPMFYKHLCFLFSPFFRHIPSFGSKQGKPENVISPD